MLSNKDTSFPLLSLVGGATKIGAGVVICEKSRITWFASKEAMSQILMTNESSTAGDLFMSQRFQKTLHAQFASNL